MKKTKVNELCPCLGGRKYKKCLGKKMSFCFLEQEVSDYKKSCLFCLSEFSEGNPRAKEHSIPKWIYKFTDQEGKIFDMSQQSFFGQIKSRRKSSANQFVEGRVCRNCNNGWMNSLEESNRDILKKLINGDIDVYDIPEEEIESLRKWMLKTVFMINSSTNYTNKIPQSHLFYLYKNEDISTLGVFADVIDYVDLTKKRISFAQTRIGSFFADQRSKILDDIFSRTKNQYIVTVQIGHLIFCVANKISRKSSFFVDTLTHKVLGDRDEIIPANKVSGQEYIKNINEKKDEYIYDFTSSVSVKVHKN